MPCNKSFSSHILYRDHNNIRGDDRNDQLNWIRDSAHSVFALSSIPTNGAFELMAAIIQLFFDTHLCESSLSAEQIQKRWLYLVAK